MTLKFGKVALIFFLFLLTGCNLFRGTPVATATLDATKIYNTSVAQSTDAWRQTQTEVALLGSSTAQAQTAAVTSTSIPTIDRTHSSLGTPVPVSSCNIAAAGNPLDVSIRDYEKLIPGQSFTKTWRIQNDGTCKWTRLYQLVFFSGNDMGAKYNHNLRGEVLPGRSVDLSVSMTAPLETGIYQGNWMLQNEDGDLFGIGPNADAPFWVIIEVVQQSTPTSTLTPTPTPTPTPIYTIFSQGSLEWVSGTRLDLDLGTPVTTGEEWDLEYAYTDGNHIFLPGMDAGLIAFGPTQPTAANCAQQVFNNTGIVYNEFPGSYYFCFKTDDNRVGRLHLLSFDAASATLSIEYLTWVTP